MRRVYVDHLKALACIAIVALHVIVNPLERLSFLDPNYYILLSMSHFTRWAVPVFVMVSGCNLLGRENEFELAGKHVKYILRIAILWGVIYVSADLIIDTLVGKEIAPMEYIENMFNGRAYHLWYCFMIAGLYALIPLLNPIIKDKKTCQYFIAICLVSSIALPGCAYLGKYIRPVGVVVEHFRFPSFGLYICYFVLGYYIDRFMINNKRTKSTLYFLAIASLLIEVVSGILYGVYTGKIATLCADLTALLTAAAVFTWFKFDFMPGKGSSLIQKIKQESLGIYLMHPYLIIRLSMKGINSITIHPFLAVPMVTILVTTVCFVASVALKKIPYLKKYIF